jgi:hypothetical protein
LCRVPHSDADYVPESCTDHVPESSLAVHEDLLQRMRHLGQGEVHMLEATETKLQHTSKFLADFLGRDFHMEKINLQQARKHTVTC